MFAFWKSSRHLPFASAIWLVLFLKGGGGLLAQDDAEKDAVFEWGISIGVHFPGDSAASFYNGDAPDDRIRSLLKRKRVRREVREELNKNFDFHRYTPSEEMSYNVAYTVGLNARYRFGEKQFSLQGELLYSRLKTEDRFFLAVEDPKLARTQIEPYPIRGEEDRFTFSLNLHKEGEAEPLKAFARLGAVIGYSEASKNRISIGSLDYSILPSAHPRYGNPEVQKGPLYGGQGALGLKLVTGADWDLSLSGKLAYSKVEIGKNPAFDLSGGFFFRLLHKGS